MKRAISIILFVIIFPLVSDAQARILYENGECHEVFGDICDLVFSFRMIFDRYPNDKKELLAFHKDVSRFDYGDDVMNAYYAKSNAYIIKEINNKKNKYSVSGDTCSLFFHKDHSTIQWIGGMKELMKMDYDSYRRWIKTCCYDKNGNYIAAYSSESPSMSRDSCKKFNYYLVMDPHYPEGEFPIIREGKRIVLIPFSITRTGPLVYDLSYLEGVSLFSQKYGDSSGSSSMNETSIEDAIDCDYLDMVKEYMTVFLEKHPDVERMRIWEAIRFNNAPSIVTHCPE